MGVASFKSIGISPSLNSTAFYQAIALVALVALTVVAASAFKHETMTVAGPVRVIDGDTVVARLTNQAQAAS